jgi:hypothetical protein
MRAYFSFANTAPRKMFEPKENRVIGRWKKLRNEEIKILYDLLFP